MTILVCDDDKEIVEAIEIYLMQEGYDVEKAYDGIQAVEIMKNKKIDLMIIDVMMPKLDGIRATLQIRKESRVPIIILSAKTEDADKKGYTTVFPIPQKSRDMNTNLKQNPGY